MTDIQSMGTSTKGTVTISTSIPYEHWKAAKDFEVSWAEALRIGLEIKLNEADPDNWDLPNIRLVQKIKDYQKELRSINDRVTRVESLIIK